MYDVWEYTVPANTAEADAIIMECKISPGTLTGLDVSFPAGCHRLARSRVLLGEKPIAPRSPKKYLAAEFYTFHIRNLNEPIVEDRPVLTWILWNLDDTYDHELWLGAEWVPEKEAATILGVASDLVRVLKLMLELK